jgi:ATP-dependent Lhr-like helicase
LLCGGANDDAGRREAEIESACRVLLRRYGVVFRDLLAREGTMPRWRELLGIFRRMEARGEVRGGRFLSGFGGEQFALPEAVESLREMRRRSDDGIEMEVAAADAMNLVGIVVPGERVTAVPGRFVRYRNGAAVGADGAVDVVDAGAEAVGALHEGLSPGLFSAASAGLREWQQESAGV